MNNESTELTGHLSTKEMEKSKPCGFLSMHLSIILTSMTSNGAEMEFKNYMLKNSDGMEVHVTNFGGIITNILTLDKMGKLGDVVLGFDRAEDYQINSGHPYFGAIIGRYGNRIAKGRFTLDGKKYELAVNHGPNHLHGGIKGFDKVFWDVSQKDNLLTLTYTSQDGEEGYPGNLKVVVTYELKPQGELRITYAAVTDKATPINLTQHTYFNLSADKSQTILDHEIMINGDEITEVDEDFIPTGKLLQVKDSEMDLTRPKRIGGGYDHNWVLRGEKGQLKLAATLFEPNSGRFLEILTTEPGIQFYSGNFLEGKLKGKNGSMYQRNAGLCLETQHFPDSPNHPNFPSTILRPGSQYTSTSIYKFTVK